MEIFNRGNTCHTGDLRILRSHMLIGSRNAANPLVSIQISDIPVDSGQPIHRHEPEQCYYIIRGKGLMMIEDEQEYVKAGDAIRIPSNKKHGIRNVGGEPLEYLTANSPAFGEGYENTLWPHKP